MWSPRMIYEAADHTRSLLRSAEVAGVSSARTVDKVRREAMVLSRFGS